MLYVYHTPSEELSLGDDINVRLAIVWSIAKYELKFHLLKIKFLLVYAFKAALFINL